MFKRLIYLLFFYTCVQVQAGGVDSKTGSENLSKLSVYNEDRSVLGVIHLDQVLSIKF